MRTILKRPLRKRSTSKIGRYSNIMPLFDDTKSNLLFMNSFVEIIIFNKAFIQPFSIDHIKIVVLKPKWKKYRMNYKPVFEHEIRFIGSNLQKIIKPRSEQILYVRYEDLLLVYLQIKELPDADLVFVIYDNESFCVGSKIYFHNVMHYRQSVLSGLYFKFLEDILKDPNEG